MNIFVDSLVALATAGSFACAVAQIPAPVLDTAVEAEGKPLPFGVQPYKSPDTPLGSGPYQTVTATDATLPAHVMYYPADLDAAGKLPIIAWGNGACVNAGNRFRYFLTEIASHGYLAIASGEMAPMAKEVGSQENPPALTPDGKPWQPPVPANGVCPPLPTRAAQLTESIEWAIKENGRQGSRFFNRFDTSKIAVAGQSCGGLQSLSVADDPRIKTEAIFNSGVFRFPIEGPTGPDPLAMIAKLHGPVIFLVGKKRRTSPFR